MLDKIIKKSQGLIHIVPFMSIIVPIYNVENYLDKCIHSLINQTNSNIEIILVNDGSKDNSAKICDKYAEVDSRITVIHKKNGGLSDARNSGLIVARGDYLMFVDSDDYISTSVCELMENLIDIHGNVDIITGNAIVIDGKEEKTIKHSFYASDSPESGGNYLKNELSLGCMSMAAWLNIYRREFLIHEKLEFKVGILHEDEQFTPRTFLKAEKVLASRDNFYYYVKREDSITRSKDKTKNAFDIFKTCNELEGIYTTLEDEDLKSLLKDSLVEKIMSAFHMARLYKMDSIPDFDEAFLLRNASKKKTIYKVKLFAFNKALYYITNVAYTKLLKNY